MSGAAPAAAAIAALGRGGEVVLLDDDGVGHLVRDARSVTGEDVVAMLDAGGGIFSVVLSASRAGELSLPEQPQRTSPRSQTSEPQRTSPRSQTSEPQRTPARSQSSEPQRTPARSPTSEPLRTSPRSQTSEPQRTPARLSQLSIQAYEGRGGQRRIAASIDAREGTTTGISAAERANTARVAADPATRSADLVVPGHVPPLIAADAGVFAGRGAPEAALDLVRLAAGSGVAAICAILDEAGHTATPAQVRATAAERGLPLATVTDVAARRIAAERPLRALHRERVVTREGTFTAISFGNQVTGEAHAALVRGEPTGRREVPLAIRSSSPVEDLLGTLAPTGESSLVAVLRRFARAESGVLIHVRDAGSEDPRALDLAAATLVELGAASVLPLDRGLAEPLRERGIEVAGPRSTPRRRLRGPGGCTDFDYEVDTAI